MGCLCGEGHTVRVLVGHLAYPLNTHHESLEESALSVFNLIEVQNLLFLSIRCDSEDK